MKPIPCSGNAAYCTPSGTLTFRESLPPAQVPLRTPPVLADHPSPRALNMAQGILSDGRWPPRHQGHRNTCSAFCTASAVELAAHCAAPDAPVPSFSEEFLYALINEVEYRDVASEVTPEEEALFDRTGGRFLGQCQMALKNGALVDAALMPYDESPDLDPAHVKSPDAALIKAARDTARTDVENYLCLKDPDGELAVGIGRRWESTAFETPQKVDVVATMIDLLQQNRPVTAGFPLLTGGSFDSWFGARALKTGRVYYPSAAKLPKLTIEGGHSVCITGYTTEGFDPGRGVFIFRNSFGRDFGWRPESGTARTRPPAKGYGTISFLDVERYCLEFMHL